MKFETGDVLAWRSTNFWDVLGEKTIRLKGYHTGVILKGEIFGKVSDCGLSPSHTYVTYLVDKVYPVEEVIGQVWFRPNGASLHLIKRISGKNVSEKKSFQIWQDYISLEKLPWSRTVHLSVVAYLKLGGVLPKPGYENKRYHLCTSVIAYILQRIGYIKKGSEINNLLPIDYFRKTFFQTVEYERFLIFDKHTTTYNWLLSTLLIRLGKYKPPSLRSRNVEKILKGYNYPQDKNVRSPRV